MSVYHIFSFIYKNYFQLQDGGLKMEKIIICIDTPDTEIQEGKVATQAFYIWLGEDTKGVFHGIPFPHLWVVYCCVMCQLNEADTTFPRIFSHLYSGLFDQKWNLWHVDDRSEALEDSPLWMPWWLEATRGWWTHWWIPFCPHSATLHSKLLPSPQPVSNSDPRFPQQKQREQTSVGLTCSSHPPSGSQMPLTSGALVSWLSSENSTYRLLCPCYSHNR